MNVDERSGVDWTMGCLMERGGFDMFVLAGGEGVGAKRKKKQDGPSNQVGKVGIERP